MTRSLHEAPYLMQILVKSVSAIIMHTVVIMHLSLILTRMIEPSQVEEFVLDAHITLWGASAVNVNLCFTDHPGKLWKLQMFVRHVIV